MNNRLLNDRYRVKEMIGGGGMANVYLAHDSILDREVAIKVLRLEYGNDEEFIARFHREAQSATSLSHPNIVNIYDVGEEEDIYYMVMEFVDGMTLKQFIQQKSPIETTEVIDIMRQVTSAITHAHDNGIVHRDIKPQNILIDHYGHVKVTDFGIAMALSATALTQTNSVLGSVHYLSPEQARGGMATKKSDIYSLGIVFFELLTGRLPFSGQSPVSIALKHLQHETPSLKRWIPDLPQSVENVVLKATTKDPFYRYESVLEMEEDLDTALEPYRINEEVFAIPENEEEEKTKAIPVITDDSFAGQDEDATIVHDATQQFDAKALEETKKEEVVKNDKKNKEKKPKEKKPKKKKRWLLWLTIIFFVLLSAGIAAIFIVPSLLQPDDVEMVDVEGMEYEEAYSELSDLNLEVKREAVFSDDVEEGLVIRTDPEAGRVIKEESRVTVYSSRGKERIEFEDYVGQNYDDVKTDLEDQGYQSVLAIEQTSDRPEGEIIEQIEPQAGDDVIIEEERVIFQVSTGPPSITLRPLEGETEEEARDYLSDNGLEASVSEEYSDDVPQGEVIRQEPGSLTEVDEGSTVELVISLGAEEEEEEEQEEEEEEEESSDNDEEQEEEEEAPREETVEVDVPFNNDSDQEEQQVLVYVEDMNNEISEVYSEEMITEDTTMEIDLTISPDNDAAYKVVIEDEVIEEENVSY
ncbi:Stk1 family PASTA domain-containing Ser/Thr kinase [Halobacillus sp. A5]|uniref:Stk1 family PASTA domain-containing Ser/Thr kinase n=1 Tax=Halobacillus sp. A5 TaxID=2880263 RepID=UPI00211172D4|nr:Stk1 family PASTA domain-containing Ser/Thr kinase [Halobacillus sp. A5]